MISYNFPMIYDFESFRIHPTGPFVLQGGPEVQKWHGAQHDPHFCKEFRQLYQGDPNQWGPKTGPIGAL